MTVTALVTAMAVVKGLGGGTVTPGNATSNFINRPIGLPVSQRRHPDANKGAPARYPSAKYAIPSKTIATICDVRNYALMFASAADSCLVTQPVSGGCRRARRRAKLGQREDHGEPAAGGVFGFHGAA